MLRINQSLSKQKINVISYLILITAILLVQLFSHSVFADAASDCEQSLTFQEKMLNSKPYGPRGFVLGNKEVSAVEMAESADIGLGEGYFQWVQSTYVISRQQINKRMEQDKLKGIERNDKFFGEYEVRNKIQVQITENSGRLTPSTAPFVMISDWTQADLQLMFERMTEEGSYKSTTNIFMEVLQREPVYSAVFNANHEFELELVPDEVKQRFAEVSIFINEPVTKTGKSGYFFSQVSWNDEDHGVIQFKDWAVTGVVKNMRKFRRKLINAGYSIEFNQTDLDEFNFVMDRCASMPRKDSPNFNSRFTEDEFESWRILFRQGKAFNVAIKDKSGNVQGGIFGYINREKGMLQGESVFYPINLKVEIMDNETSEIESRELVWSNKDFAYITGEYEEIREYFNSATENQTTALTFAGGQPDFAKVVLLTLGERAIQAGLNFIDAGIVTEYTASMKGKYLKSIEWKELVKESHSRGAQDIDLETPYTEQDELQATKLIEKQFLPEAIPVLLVEAYKYRRQALEYSDILDENERRELDILISQLEVNEVSLESAQGQLNMELYKQTLALVNRLKVLVVGDLNVKGKNVLGSKNKPQKAKK